MHILNSNRCLPEVSSAQALLFLSLLLLGFLPRPAFAQNDLDSRLFRTINNGRSPLMGSIVNVTDATVEPVGYALPLVLLGVGGLTRDGDIFDTGFLLTGSEISSAILIQSLKHIVARDRPYIRLRNVYVGHLESSDPYSFPSGHTGTSFGVATMLSLRYPRLTVIVPAFLWAAAVGYGRIYLGLHYPGDVLAGAVIGTGCSVIAYIYRDNVLKIRRALFGDRWRVIVLPYEGGGAVRVSYAL